jgi:quercetin dioxygenase-like cupin family protein
LTTTTVLFCGAVLCSFSVAAHARRPVALFVSSTDARWTDLPSEPGVKVAPVEGDPRRGPAHFFLKFPAGFTAARHHHTADHYGTVVSGNLIVTTDDGVKLLPAGSFFAFAGLATHATRCDPANECIVFIDARGRWDNVASYPVKGVRGRKPDLRTASPAARP